MTESNYKWRIENQIHYPLINEAELSPDGRRVAYTVREPLLTDERSEFITHLYLADVDGGQPLQLTHGQHSNSSPRWSPDGRYIAFISTRNEKPNVYAIATLGGEAWALTGNKKTGVTSVRWSPDGQTLGFLMTEPPTEEKEKADKAKDDAILWHEDYQYTHLYTVPFKVGPREPLTPRQVTCGEFHIIDFDWIPNTSKAAILHRPTPLAEDWTRSRIATVSMDADEPTCVDGVNDVAQVSTFQSSLKVSPNGRWIAAPTSEQPPSWAFSTRMILYPVDGGDPKPLAWTPDSQPAIAGWSGDSGAVYFTENQGVSSQIYRLPVTGDPPVKVTVSMTRKKAVSVNRAGSVVFAAEDFNMPNALFLLEGGGEKLITKPPMPEGWPTAHVPKSEVVQWNSPDGTPVEGVLTYPLSYVKGKRYPLVVEVHGGPTGVYGRSYYPAPLNHGNTAMLTERGFMMLRANPRGSSGYGKEFRFGNYDDWGGGDFADIMSGVNALIDRGLVDPDRMGVLGWSYGGFMTSWVITQTGRFKAAVVGAGLTNLMSFNGTSDIPSFVPDYFHGQSWENLDAYMRHSAMFNVDAVTTPTLIQHGEKDDRVPVTQGQELYNALKIMGVPVRMAIYPRQPHGIGEPRLVVDVRSRPVAWFMKYVLGKE